MPDHTLSKTRLCYPYNVSVYGPPARSMTQYTFCEKNILQILKSSSKPAHLLTAVTNGLGYRTEYSCAVA